MFIFRTSLKKIALCVYGEYAKQQNKHYKCVQYISVYIIKIKKIYQILFIYIIWDRLSKNHLTLLSL
jgi:hypothetical protein